MEDAAPAHLAPEPRAPEPVAPERLSPERLVVADSFRVRVQDGVAEVRGFERHLARFEASVSIVTGGSLPAVGTFLEHCRAQIAAFGEGFPRLELWERAAPGAPMPGEDEPDSREPSMFSMRLALRPLPGLRDTIELRTALGVALERPRVKGANLGVLGELNRQLGAEALLIDAAGHVREGATTSVLWWEDDVLCSVASQERVQSIAETLLLEAASASGIRTCARSITPAELATHEVWAVNALHGVRPVTALDGERPITGPSERLDEFRKMLASFWSRVQA